MNERPNNPATSELNDLIGAYCNGTLSSDDFARLERLLLADVSARAYFRRYVALDAALRDHGESAAVQWAPNVEGGVAKAASLPKQAEQSDQEPKPSRATNLRSIFPWLGKSRLRLVALAATLMVCIAVLLLVILAPHRTQRIAKLQHVTGDVRIFTAAGQATTVTSDTAINNGDSVRTRGSHSSTTLAYPDGTLLTLVGNTLVTCGDDEAKSVVVHHGTLAASVQPQPAGKSMLLTTPLAQVKVLGTRFLLDTVANRTDLSVSEGRVWLKRIKDGKAVEITNGAYAVLTEQDELLVKNSPALRPSWQVDFESGLPEGWETGELVGNGLPTGSRGALKAVRYSDWSGEITYGIRSNEAWVQGLFAIQKQSHLHLTFRMDSPSWINVFLSTRTSDSRAPSFSANYMFNSFPKITADQWQTVTIPLASFKRLSAGTQPLEQLVPFKLIITTSGPGLGLVIDRIWVTADGSGNVTVERLE